MLPDFRFVLGAVLALAMIAVGGLGLVTSVQLVREAHMAPLEESRSLAFAGRAEWNQFYDPEAARRFEGLAGKTEAPVAEARLERPAETSAPASPVPAPPMMAPPAITPADPEERTAAIPAHRPELVPEVAPVYAEDKAPEKEADPPAPQPIAAAPAETAAPNGERIASLPILSPGSDPRGESRTPPPESGPARPEATDAHPPDSAPPTPRARPKVHFHRRIARVHFRRILPVAPQPLDNAGFPPSNPPWPGYDNQITGTTAKKNAGKLSGTLTSRPQ